MFYNRTAYLIQARNARAKDPLKKVSYCSLIRDSIVPKILTTVRLKFTTPKNSVLTLGMAGNSDNLSLL